MSMNCWRDCTRDLLSEAPYSARSLTLMTARAIDLMRGMLDRGFTTVRDTGGADWGIKAAVDQGLVDNGWFVS